MLPDRKLALQLSLSMNSFASHKGVACETRPDQINAGRSHPIADLAPRLGTRIRVRRCAVLQLRSNIAYSWTSRKVVRTYCDPRNADTPPSASKNRTCVGLRESVALTFRDTRCSNETKMSISAHFERRENLRESVE